MSLARIPRACERAHASISAALDGELSELDAAALDAHLGRCPACAAYRREVVAATHRLRTTPPEELEHGIVLPLRRSSVMRSLNVAAAAAVVVVGAVLGSTVALRSEQAPRSERTVRSTVPDLTRELTFVPPRPTVLTTRARIRV